jgi:hypothetical protein
VPILRREAGRACIRAMPGATRRGTNTSRRRVIGSSIGSDDPSVEADLQSAAAATRAVLRWGGMSLIPLVVVSGRVAWVPFQSGTG